MILRYFQTLGIVSVLILAGCKNTINKTHFLPCRSVVRLDGVIEDKIFPGPPNYEDITRGDEPEDCWILRLREPIDVAEDPDYPVPNENSPVKDVYEIQLNMDVHLNTDYKEYQQFLGKPVVVVGELTQGFTIHHKTAVLIEVQEIRMR